MPASPSLLIVPARFKTGKLYTQIATTSAGVVLASSGDFNVTRATTATRFNSAGLIESVASGIPRLDYFTSGGTAGCPALLVEPAATNQIRNNSASGAVTGTPGTLPTNWSVVGNTLGLSGEITAIGVENGVPYLDYKITGTATSSADRNLGFETTTQITALSGQLWTNSFYAKIVSAPNPPTQYVASIFERSAAGSFITTQLNAVTIGSSLTRVQRIGTALGATTERLQPAISFSVVSGSTYDFTVRIGYPQMELGSVATTVIPTTAAIGTRNADVINLSGAVSGCIGQTEGTIYAELNVSNFTLFARAFAISDGTTSNRILFQKTSNNRLQLIVRTAGASIADIATGNNQATGNYKVAVAYANNDFVFYVNGSLIGSVTSGAVPACNQVFLGKIETSANSDQWNDRIRAAALYTTRLTNAELAALTTL